MRVQMPAGGAQSISRISRRMIVALLSASLGIMVLSAPTASAISGITSITPATGPVAGGTSVTIAGTGFNADSVVTIGGVPATSITVVSSTEITAVTGAHAVGAVDVVVTSATDSTTFTLPAGFTYVSTPTITSITPDTGFAVGGTAVTIVGTGFVAGASVTIGATDAAGVFVDATHMTATTAVHAAGAVDVVVTNPDSGAATATNGFT